MSLSEYYDYDRKKIKPLVQKFFEEVKETLKDFNIQREEPFWLTLFRYTNCDDFAVQKIITLLEIEDLRPIVIPHLKWKNFYIDHEKEITFSYWEDKRCWHLIVYLICPVRSFTYKVYKEDFDSL